MVVPASETLPGKVVVIKRKTAREATNSLLVRVKKLLPATAGLLKHCSMLTWRDAKTVNSYGLPPHPSYKAIVEKWSEVFIKNLLLLSKRASFQKFGWISSHPTREPVYNAEELPKFRLVV